MLYGKFDHGDLVLCDTEEYGKFLGEVVEESSYTITVRPKSYLRNSLGLGYDETLKIDVSRVKYAGDDGQEVLNRAESVAYKTQQRFEEKTGAKDTGIYYVATRGYIEEYYSHFQAIARLPAQKPR